MLRRTLVAALAALSSSATFAAANMADRFDPAAETFAQGNVTRDAQTRIVEVFGTARGREIVLRVRYLAGVESRMPAAFSINGAPWIVLADATPEALASAVDEAMRDAPASKCGAPMIQGPSRGGGRKPPPPGPKCNEDELFAAVMAAIAADFQSVLYEFPPWDTGERERCLERCDQVADASLILCSILALSAGPEAGLGCAIGATGWKYYCRSNCPG